jgi:hypothetical protein
MKLRQRATRVVWVESHGLLLATDNQGGVHLLDEDFTVVTSGRHPESHEAIYAVTLSESHVYTRDRRGTITQWTLPDLRPVNILDAHNLRGSGEYLDGEEPSTVINRGICVWQDRLYVNNGYCEIVVLAVPSMDVVDVVPGITGTFLEWFCTDRPGEQAVADKQGNLFIGDLSKLDFPVHVRIDENSNLHRVKYDARHDRYWVTQDAGIDDGFYVSNGLVVISPDAEKLHDFKFATDDVEVLEFSPDFTRVYSGGFDGEIVVFDNTDAEPRQIGTIAPFRHQIIDMTMTSSGDLVVATQDGQVERLGPDGERKAALDFDSSCVWDLQPDPLVPDGYLAATDTGVVEVSVVDKDRSHPNIRTGTSWDLGLGFVRRVRPLADGSFLGISRSGMLFRCGRDGTMAWQTPFLPHLHDIAVTEGGARVLVASNEGAIEVDTATGERIRTLDVAGLVTWTCGYGPDGELVVGTRNGSLICFEQDGSVRWHLEFDGGYFKRIRAMEDRMLVTGGGIGAALIDYADGKIHGQWQDGLENTVESGVMVHDRVYATSYGLQLGVYETSAPELLGMIEPFQDFPKALADVATPGRDLLLVGGRGGFLQIREITPEGPVLLRTTYLPGYGS